MDSDSLESAAASGTDRAALSIALILSVTIVAMTLLLWQQVKKRDSELVQIALSDEAASLHDHLRTRIHTVMLALERMADRWEASNGTQRLAWHQDARNYIRDNPGLQAVEWVDARWHVRWIEPLAGNEAAKGLYLGFEENRRSTLESAMQSGEPQISAPIDLVQGGKGLLAFFPLQVNREFSGFILGVFNIDRMISEFIPVSASDRYGIALSIGGTRVYTSAEATATVQDGLTQSHSETLFGKAWRLDIWPTEAFFAQSHLSVMILFAGAGIAASFSWAVYLAITSRRQSRHLRWQTVALTQSESEHRVLLDTIVDGIISIDEQGTVIRFNRACEQIFGYQPDDVIGQNVKMLMPDPYHSEHDSYLHNYRRTGDRKIIGIGREVEGRRKNGEIFPLDLAVSEVSIAGKRSFTGIVRDISERKLAEEAILRSESEHRGVLENVAEGLVTIDNQGVVTRINPACERIFGYESGEVVGRNVKMLMPDPYHSEHDAYLHNYRSTGEKKIIGIGREVSGRRKSGDVFPIELAVSEVNVGGRQLFTGIVRDISDRKAVEMRGELVKSVALGANQTRSRDELLRTVLSSMGSITGFPVAHAYRWDGESAQLVSTQSWYCEKRKKERFAEFISLSESTTFSSGVGLPGGVLACQRACWVADLQADDNCPRLKLLSTPSVASGFAFPVTVNGQVQLILEFFSDRVVQADPELLKTVDEISVQLSHVLERNAAEEHLTESIAKLEISNQELDDFAYIASHDLKEPLRGVHNNAMFLQEDYADLLDEDGVKKLKRLTYLSKRMETLISDLLYFSRLGRQELALKPTNLNEVVDDLRDTMQEFLADANAQLVAQPLPIMRCDAVRITELLRNLVLNAIKYNESSEKRVEISAISGSPTIISVRDNGIGIEEEFHDDIFRIFKRLHSIKRFGEGTGSGLTFVKKIVDRHGGKIWLESEPGQGTTFYFTVEKTQ